MLLPLSFLLSFLEHHFLLRPPREHDCSIRFHWFTVVVRRGRNNEEPSLGGDFPEILAKSRTWHGSFYEGDLLHRDQALDILFERDSSRLERRFKLSPVVIVAGNENEKDLTFLRWGCTTPLQPIFLLEIHLGHISPPPFPAFLPLHKILKKERKKKIRNARRGLFDRSRINGGRINPWRWLKGGWNFWF